MCTKCICFRLLKVASSWNPLSSGIRWPAKLLVALDSPCRPLALAVEPAELPGGTAKQANKCRKCEQDILTSYTHLHWRIHTHIYIYMYIHTDTHTQTHTHVNSHVYIYICIHYVYVYIYIYYRYVPTISTVPTTPIVPIVFTVQYPPRDRTSVPRLCTHRTVPIESVPCWIIRKHPFHCLTR